MGERVRDRRTALWLTLSAAVLIVAGVLSLIVFLRPELIALAG